MTFAPQPQGRFAPVGEWVHEQGKPPRFVLAKHPHVMRIVSWTEDGPLRVLLSCPDCSKTEAIEPSRLVRNIPAGFTPSAWNELLDKADARALASGFLSHREWVRSVRAALTRSQHLLDYAFHSSGVPAPHDRLDP